MTLQVAVLGAGAFGRNHIRILHELASSGYPVQVSALVEPDPDRAAAAIGASASSVPSKNAGAHTTAIFTSVDALLVAIRAHELEVHAALVCTPTSTHHAVAAPLLAAGIHILVEKPIASTLDQADELIALASKHRLVLQVGHLERFNPAVQAVKSLLRGPMFFEAHRLSVFSPRSLDTDVVLDLMIHDLDIVLSIADSPVLDVRAVGLPILSRKTDIANVRIEFASGAVANFTASRVSTERVRKLRFFQPHQYVSIDYARQDLLLIDVQPSDDLALMPGSGSSAAAHPTLGIHKPQVLAGEPLRVEIQSFLEAVRLGKEPEVTGPQARAALALALQIQTAIDRHTSFAGLQAFSNS